MDPLPVSYCVEACAGAVLHGDGGVVFRGVSTDTRQLGEGQLFVALVGDRFDGHAYLGEAVRRGAAALVVERGRWQRAGIGCPVVEVENARAALGQLAARWRGELGLPVIAVAGSNGKTTTKELLAAVLGQRLPTLASEASFNNDVGVPLTLLRLDRTHQAAVLEAGSNHPGELAPLLRMIRPSVGVLTSLGREHLEFFGDLAGVAQEEGWLAELLPADGHLFANGDMPMLGQVTGRSRATVTLAGFGPELAWRATGLVADDTGSSFELECPSVTARGRYRLNLLGRHQVSNALLALAVGSHLGLGWEEMARGLAGCRPPRRRMESRMVGGVRVLDDAYNANADSMLAALRTLREMPCAGRRIAVLGDMTESGPGAEALHAEVGRCSAEMQVDQLVVVGRMAAVTAAAARSAGLGRVLEFGDAQNATEAVRHLARDGDVVLVKASRASRLEVVSEGLHG